MKSFMLYHISVFIIAPTWPQKSGSLRKTTPIVLPCHKIRHLQRN